MATFIPDCEGIYTVGLEVSDGYSTSDLVHCNVLVGDTNRPPVVEARFGGAPPCDGGIVQLNGYGTYDPDSDPLEYQWHFEEVPKGSAITDADLDDPVTEGPTFVADVPGSYTLSLTVTDGIFTEMDEVTFEVVGADANQAPIADAGSYDPIIVNTTCTNDGDSWDCEPCVGHEIEVDGTASFDPEGDFVSYAWTVTGDAFSLDTPGWQTSLAVLPDMEGAIGSGVSYTYEVMLEVSDCVGSTMDVAEFEVICRGSP